MALSFIRTTYRKLQRRFRATRQGTFTVVAPIRADGEERLRALLQQVREAVEGGTPVESAIQIPFKAVTSLHYARFVILPQEQGPDGTVHPASLLFSTQFDRPFDEHLGALLEAAEPALVEIFACCQWFNAEAGTPATRLRNYWKRHSHRAGAFHVAARGRSRRRIEWEEDLVRRIRRFLATDPLLNDTPLEPHELFRAIRTHVEGRLSRPPDLAPNLWILRAGRIVFRAGQLLLAALFLWLAYQLPIAATGLVALVGFLIVWIRLLEYTDEDQDATREATRTDALLATKEEEREQELAEAEDRWHQNQMTEVSFVKDSTLRRWMQRITLWIVALRGKTKFAGGLLHDVPTIHFAHWLVFAKGRRLLFASNYDGSWSAYLDDFIAQAPKAINLIWTHNVEFPKTRFLVFGGIEDRARFKAAVRRVQLPPEVWFAAYPHLAASEVRNHSEIVAGLKKRRLGKARYREQTLAWLARI